MWKMSYGTRWKFHLNGVTINSGVSFVGAPRKQVTIEDPVKALEICELIEKTIEAIDDCEKLFAGRTINKQ